MDENLPSVTVLVAARPGQAEVKAVDASRALDYPAEKLEIIVARGKQPSVQRNAALRAARGELIYFLDDDSVPDCANLRRAITHFNRPEVKMLGGPNLCPPEAPTLEQVFALVLGCRLAFGPSRARYTPVGRVRETSEKELILCNLVAHRDALLELGGFNEALYPNEENALMDELQRRGGKLLYDPDLIVFRRPRASLRSFAKMLLTYGRGRAEQFRLHPTPGSALNLVPPLFLAYLIFVPPLFFAYLVLLVAKPWVGTLLFAPLGLYAIAVLGQAAVLKVQSPKSKVQSSPDGVSSLKSQVSRPEATVGSPQSTEVQSPKSKVQSPKSTRQDSRLGVGQQIIRRVAVIPLIVLTHVLYGAGFWRGLFTKLGPGAQRPPPSVVLETLAK